MGEVLLPKQNEWACVLHDSTDICLARSPLVHTFALRRLRPVGENVQIPIFANPSEIPVFQIRDSKQRNNILIAATLGCATPDFLSVNVHVTMAYVLDPDSIANNYGFAERCSLVV